MDDIFEKRLLLLIPFYIFSYEMNFPEYIPASKMICQQITVIVKVEANHLANKYAHEYNSNEQKLAELESEYLDILKKLDELERQKVIGVFDKRTIIEHSSDVIKEITQKYKNVQKGIGDIMGGH